MIPEKRVQTNLKYYLYNILNFDHFHKVFNTIVVQRNKNNKSLPPEKKPPDRSKNIFSDIRQFLISTPEVSTFIPFRTFNDRLNFRHRILQRTGMDASNYTVLNVHKIGINVPVNHVFEELLQWNGESTCWPNHIATANRINNKIEHIEILLFGQKKYPFRIKNGILGFKYIPLFKLDYKKIQSVPGVGDDDNARYLLYKCSGGYPIGFFTMYIRSSIADQNEKEQAQLFFSVGFDFFGNKGWTKKHIVVKIWAMIHNRVTSNVMNRFKQLCEWRFEKIQQG